MYLDDESNGTAGVVERNSRNDTSTIPTTLSETDPRIKLMKYGTTSLHNI